MTELDPNLIGNLESQSRRDGLYGTGYEGTDAARIDAEQAEVVRLLRDNGPRDLVAAMIAAAQIQWRKDEYYFSVGDAERFVAIPVLGDDLSQWALDHIVTWCPQGNSAPGSVTAGNQAASPGAGAAITTLVIPVTGQYNVTVSIELSGTAETSTENLQLLGAGGFFTGHLPTITGQVSTINLGQLNLQQGNLTANAIAAATVGAVYSVNIVATPIGASNGEVLVQFGNNIQAGGNLFKIPAVIQATKNIQKTDIQLPVAQVEGTSLSVTGTTGDRVAVIFVYKRGG